MHHHRFRGYFVLVAVAALALAWAGVVAARDRDEVMKEFNATFEQMLKHPSDESIALRYSELAEELGDYEAAIPPLERLLILNPDRMDLKMKAGMMYYRLKSYEMAKAYMLDILNNPAASEEARKQAKKYLDEIKWKVY